MSSTETTDIAIIGGGLAGILVANELAGPGAEVTVVERGAFKSHADQLRDNAHSSAVITADDDYEAAEGTLAERFEFIYGVGGSGLHWGGVTPRFMPSDFELRSRYGVGRDWPISYEDLEPYYRLAERALSIAGGPNDVFGPGYRPPLPAHPQAPVDRLLSEYLDPYYSLPQARPTRSVGGRPPCCGSGQCNLCPVDARYSPLHTLEPLRLREGFRLREQTVVARIRPAEKRGWMLEGVDSNREPVRLLAKTVVVAANGVENAAVLLRSALGGDEVGRWLSDHEHTRFRIELDRSARTGHGSSISTGISYAWADGSWRGRRGSLLVYPDNRGPYMGEDLTAAIAAGKRGRALQREVTARFDRTIALETIGEDLPQARRRVTLGSTKDAVGVPRPRISYPPDSAYLGRSLAFFAEDVVRRLSPLGARIVGTSTYGGGHLLGTCRMGKGEGVVDPDGLVHGTEGLYVVGGSMFPTCSAAHPTLTIAALAIRLGRHLANRA